MTQPEQKQLLAILSSFALTQVNAPRSFKTAAAKWPPSKGDEVRLASAMDNRDLFQRSSILVALC